MRGQAPLPPHSRGGPTSTHSWLKHASLRPSSRRSTARCGCFEPPPPGSLHARRTRTRVGPTGPRSHQRRLQRRRSEHAPASEPEAHCCRNAVTGHARPLDALGAEPAPRGAGAYRASGRPTGRKLSARIRQQGSARDDGGAQGPEPSVHTGGAVERPANPGRTPAKERLLDTCGQVQDGDACNIINARRTGNAETRATAGYHP
jgi:hypothetical protein